MLVTKHLSLALSGAALLLSHAQATFDFPDCVDSCIVSSGCQPTNAKCMCKKAAEDLLLDSVVSCLFFSCKSDLRNFEASFLGPIEQGCDDSARDIPSSKLKAAESLASSWISKLPATTTADKSPTGQATSTPPKTTAKPNPTTTSEQAASSSTTTTSDDDSDSTSTSDEVTEQSTTSAAGETTAAPTQVTVSTTVTRNPAASSASPGSNSGSGSDTNPFGGSSSAASAIQPLLSLFGLPLALGLLALR